MQGGGMGAPLYPASQPGVHLGGDGCSSRALGRAPGERVWGSYNYSIEPRPQSGGGALHPPSRGALVTTGASWLVLLIPWMGDRKGPPALGEFSGVRNAELMSS